MNQRHGNENWINPLLKRLNLLPNEEPITPDAYWKQIEDCELAERVGKIVSEINRAAGYHVLEMLEFLPPQKNILRISFERHRVKHNLEIVIRDSGIVLMFSTRRRISIGWGRYVASYSSKSDSALVWEEVISPEEVLDENIQAWLSYLLSGLDKKFRLDQILHASSNSQAELSASLRKASA